MAHFRKNGGKLSRKAEQAIAALLANPTIAEAATACGVSERSLWRWLQNPDFQRRFKEAQAAAFDDAVRELQAASIVAARTLREVAEDKEASASARVAAALGIFTQTYKGREQGDLLQRVERLQAMLEALEREKKRWA